MQLDAILEVAIGLVFVWLILSVVTLEIQNLLSKLLDWRADHLAQAVLGMLKDETLVARFYEHPLIMELAPKGADGKTKTTRKGAVKLPEQIPSAAFARVACEVIMNAGKPNTMSAGVSLAGMNASAKELMQKNPNLGKVNEYLMPRMDDATGNVEAFIQKYRQNAEDWFNGVMAQASSAYKLHAQKWALIIGLLVALTLNIDTIHVAQKLWQEPTARAILVAQAQSSSEQPMDAIAAAQSLTFPIGWTTSALHRTDCTSMDMIDWQIVFKSAGQCRALTSLPAFNNPWGWVVKLAGYLLSAAAAAQGAPFWFDVLRKLIGLNKQPLPAKDGKSAAA